MLLEYTENIIQLAANLTALLLCLFQYIGSGRKGWIYATFVFLCTLMSSYYWTAYLLIMGTTPNVSNLFSYIGWNIAYFFLLILLLHMKSPEERRYFHPLMLLPIPLNIWQLSLYLPYGGKLNSIYQVGVLTAVACFSLQGFCWYWENRDSGAKKPYVSAACLLYVIAEFGMWTSSSINWPSESLYNLYYPFSFLYSASFLVLVWAIRRSYQDDPRQVSGWADQKYRTALKAAYFIIVLLCCIGGILLGFWMKNVMAASLDQGAESNIYDIIPVVLFIISLFLAAFAIVILLVVNFGEKVAENNELREARRIAEHSSEAKSEFLANMSHEIRTPINAVLGMNEMILRESRQARDRLPEDRAAIRAVFSDLCNYAGNIENAGNSLLSIINDILDVSKIEAGKLEIVESGYQLSAVLNDVCNMVAFKAREKGLDFLADVDAGLPDGLYGDEMRIRQILTNVLNNAVKYTPAGSVLLSVRSDTDTPPAVGEQIRLKITVADTGIGIREEDVEKVFQKFERVDLQTNSTVEGTGLGLSITNSLLDMMGGSIEVKSVYGEGSSFIITLPQKVLSTEPTGDFEGKFRKNLQEAALYQESFRAPDAHILIVDDTRMNLTVAVSLLKNTEIRIDTALSGAESLSLCERVSYDLILMDQRMPGMDGTEALHWIRGQEGGVNRDTPVICLTADAVSGARERYLSEGFTDYLTKPIDSRALEQMLMRYLPAEKLSVNRREEPLPADAEERCPGNGSELFRAAGADPAAASARHSREDDRLPAPEAAQEKKKAGMKSLRVKMTVMIVLVVLVSMGLLLLISYERARESMSVQLENNYSAVADRYTQQLTAWINTNATVIDSLAAEITATGMDTGSRETFHRFLSDTYDLLNKDGYIYDIYFTYPDNSMVCASDYVPDGTVDYSHDRDWFTRAAGTGELFYSTPYRDSDTGKTVITISKAVFRENRLQGVLAADIFVDVLADIIRDADVAEDSYAFLVDQNLGMIVHPYEAYAFTDVPRSVMDVPGMPYADVISKIRSGSNETVYLEDYDGVTRGVVVSRMENTGWYVGIATSKAELMSGMNSLIRGYLLAAGIAVVISAVFAVFLSQALERMGLQPQTAEEQEKLAKKQAAEKARQEAAEKPQELVLGGRIGMLFPILVIFLLMVIMVLYTSRVINSVAATNIREVGEDRISASAAQLENYLERTRSSLWVTADTVDLMVRSGVSSQDIHRYIVEETDNQIRQFDEDINGFYGWVLGEYQDGLDWVPPENYDPTRRDWYLAALEAEGEVAIVPPYVDAWTGDVIISLSRMLSDGTDVLSLDVRMNRIQEIVSGLQLKGKGYGFVVNRQGMIIAHQDEGRKGRTLTETEDQLALLDRILEVENGSFEITLGGQKSIVFVQPIMDQWYVVIVISNQELLAEVRQQLAVNVLICFVIFALIAVSYYLGHRREQKYSRRIEEMRVEEQKQAYEAKALKLEKEAADQANQAKSDFLADMSHEIRTPINAVLGMNEMVLRESDRAQGLVEPDAGAVRTALDNIGTYAANIERAGRNLLSIINDILDFSKIEAGKTDIVEGPYRLSALLSDVSSMVFLRAQEKGLQFLIHVDNTLPDGLYGDEVHVRQILTNILNNAVKYTSRGSVSMEIKSSENDRIEVGETVHLIIAVRDTGIGIREEDIAKLFTKFQRVDLDANSTVEGTGLGLAITRSLLTMMSGSIQVESVYGEGSTFTVTLPQKIVSCEPAGGIRTRPEEHALEGRAYEESFRAPDARILIVDDTPMNLTVAVALLKDTEIRIDTASGGEEALGLTQAKEYDLILMDQRMPRMDGTEALRRIRAQENGANRKTPVICLTADAVIGAKERYLAEGFTDYLTKPIDSRELEQMLMRYLPQEKLVAVQREKQDPGSSDSADAGEDRYAPLRRAGISPEVGLRYCQKDETLYGSLLRDYAGNAEQKAREIEGFYASGDWKNYAILVHSLKSSSRMIGATALSEMAAKQEAAADEGRESEIAAGHGAMLSLFKDTANAVRALIRSPEAPSEEDSAARQFTSGEEEIMEFLPE